MTPAKFLRRPIPEQQILGCNAAYAARHRPTVLGASAGSARGTVILRSFSLCCWFEVYSESELIGLYNGHLGVAPHNSSGPSNVAPRERTRERILETSIARTFAALSATNEAILYAKSPEELYRQVCEAAFSSGDFLATAVFLLEPATNRLRFAVGFGDDVKRLCEIDISIASDIAEGTGVCGQAFRDQKISISNDYLNDARSLAWREGTTEAHIGAAAALPLICNGCSAGVLLVTLREAGSLNDRVVSLLERMSANISFALDNFDHEAARKDGERAMRRLNRMFGAISATNEALLRAKTEQELYRLVCDAAVHSGKSTATVVLLAEPDSIWLKPVAGTGAISNRSRGHASRSTRTMSSARALSAAPFERKKPASTAISSTRRRRGRGTNWAARSASWPALRFRSSRRQERRRAAVLRHHILGGG